LKKLFLIYGLPTLKGYTCRKFGPPGKEAKQPLPLQLLFSIFWSSAPDLEATTLCLVFSWGRPVMSSLKATVSTLFVIG